MLPGGRVLYRAINLVPTSTIAPQPETKAALQETEATAQQCARRACAQHAASQLAVVDRGKETSPYRLRRSGGYARAIYNCRLLSILQVAEL